MHSEDPSVHVTGHGSNHTADNKDMNDNTLSFNCELKNGFQVEMTYTEQCFSFKYKIWNAEYQNHFDNRFDCDLNEEQ